MVMVVCEAEDKMLSRYGDWQCNAYKRPMEAIAAHKMYSYDKQTLTSEGDIIIYVTPTITV